MSLVPFYTEERPQKMCLFTHQSNIHEWCKMWFWLFTIVILFHFFFCSVFTVSYVSYMICTQWLESFIVIKEFCCWECRPPKTEHYWQSYCIEERGLVLMYAASVCLLNWVLLFALPLTTCNDVFTDLENSQKKHSELIKLTETYSDSIDKECMNYHMILGFYIKHKLCTSDIYINIFLRPAELLAGDYLQKTVNLHTML